MLEEEREYFDNFQLVHVDRTSLKLSVDIYFQIYIFTSFKLNRMLHTHTHRFVTHSPNIVKAARVEYIIIYISRLFI